jgi:hypothetical protein
MAAGAMISLPDSFAGAGLQPDPAIIFGARNIGFSKENAEACRLEMLIIRERVCDAQPTHHDER